MILSLFGPLQKGVPRVKIFKNRKFSKFSIFGGYMRVFEISIFLTLRKPFFEALRSQICPQKIHPIPLPPIFGILDPPKDTVFFLDQGGTLASAGGGRRTSIFPVPVLGHKKVVETTLLRKCWLGVKNNLLWSFKRFLPIKSSKNNFGGGLVRKIGKKPL